MSKHSTDHPSKSPEEHLAKAKESVQQAGQEIAAAATTKAAEVIGTAQTQLETRTKELWESVQDSPLFSEPRRLMKEEPLKAGLMIFGAGILVGLTLRR